MFTTLFTLPAVQARHLTAPYAESREQFLRHCKELGYLPSSLEKIAWILLVLAKNDELCSSKRISLQQIELACDQRSYLFSRKNREYPAESSRQMFIHFAIAWFRYRGNFVEPQFSKDILSFYIGEFSHFMFHDRGLSPITIKNRCQKIRNFLDTYLKPEMSLNTISIKNVDDYLATKGIKGWSRESLHTLASSLRNFFRYAEGCGWTSGISQNIEAPRVFSHEAIPMGLDWNIVQQLVENTAGDSTANIRDRAIIFLLATYGLRRGEVALLHIDDIDWESETLRVIRPKQRYTHCYPLVSSVGNAIVRYLKEVRPKCKHRELFLTLHAPMRPLHPSSISAIVHSRLSSIGVTRRRFGAHCLRHACAQHLLEAGFSLKQIGDQLGHHSTSATLRYTKIDLNSLRQVAELDIGGVL